jgi:hypothetical protein
MLEIKKLDKDYVMPNGFKPSGTHGLYEGGYMQTDGTLEKLQDLLRMVRIKNEALSPASLEEVEPR